MKKLIGLLGVSVLGLSLALPAFAQVEGGPVKKPTPKEQRIKAIKEHRARVQKIREERIEAIRAHRMGKR